jgi:hypothetical protein
MSDEPERIWADVEHTISGGKRYSVHGYWSNEPIGERPEYIRKETADKEKVEAVEYYHAIEEACDERLKEILQPIRDLNKKHDIGNKFSFDSVCNETLRAINETLALADKDKA